MIKIERSYPGPQSLNEEAKKGIHGRYDLKDVVDQLYDDFHGKCYICEIDQLQDPQIEHLHPHHGRKLIQRVFDWDNLFLSCSHCNSVKNNQYYGDDIIDCCKRNPEKLLDSQWINGDVVVTALNENDIEALKTAKLIEDVFNNSNTEMRNRKSTLRMKELTLEMNTFFKMLEQYKEDSSSVIAKRAIRSMLNENSRFAAFKRSYIRKHQDDYIGINFS